MANPSLQFDRNIGTKLVREIGSELGGIRRLGFVRKFNRHMVAIDVDALDDDR